MTIRLTTDVVDELAEMERRVKIEQDSEAKHTERCIGEVEHIEEITTCEHPLHYKGVKDESVKDAHAETTLSHSCGHAKRKQPQYESICCENVEIKEHNTIGPDLEL